MDVSNRKLLFHDYARKGRDPDWGSPHAWKMTSISSMNSGTTRKCRSQACSHLISSKKKVALVSLSIWNNNKSCNNKNAVRELGQWNHCQKHPVSVFRLTFWSPRKETSQFVSFLCQNCYLIPIEGSWTPGWPWELGGLGFHYRTLKGRLGSVVPHQLDVLSR